MNALIFLSYSSKDKLLTDAICSRLENQGIRCWIAPRDVNPGSDYSNQIADALEASTAMVMVFSSESNASRHVKSEIDRAFGLGKMIIPFRVENVELDKGLAYYLAKTHWLDAVTKPLDQHIDRLAATLRQISGVETADAIAPPPRAPVLPGSPVAPQRSNTKALWLVGGIVALCVFLACVGAAWMWLNHKKADNSVAARPPQNLVIPSAPAASIAPSQSAAVVSAKTTVRPEPPRPARGAFQGTWTVSDAETLTDTPYSGTVKIHGETDRYEVTWRTTGNDGSGIGLANGNQLCVAFGQEDVGVVIYKVAPDGKLKGKWTQSGPGSDENNGLENATGGSPGEITGEYDVKGSRPDGEAYEGKLKIAKTGKTYQLHWEVAGLAIRGVGIQIDDTLFVAWAEKKPVGVVVYSFDGSQAKGVWTLAGESKIATENLMK
jgi:hypothetical protein